MMPLKKCAWLAPAVLAIAAVAGCMANYSAPGTIDRAFTVNGPVRLEITNSNGDSKVVAGPPGQVRVHADFRVKSWSASSAHKRVADLSANPPISQDGNLIQIGGWLPASSRLTIDYTIIVPADSQIHETTQSGDIETTGIQGPANFSSTSGNISATAISGDVQARSASGTIQLWSVQGQVEATTGSGNVNLADVRRDVRIQTGSGSIRLAQPGGAVEASSGSGDINAVRVKDDLRVRTNSGNITVEGDPKATNYWDIRASSGNVILQVPTTASFRFYAKTDSGDINAAIPIVMEGTAGKHALRARIGDGKARVEVETTSGNVALH
jgi:Putative adhesin